MFSNAFSSLELLLTFLALVLIDWHLSSVKINFIPFMSSFELRAVDDFHCLTSKAGVFSQLSRRTISKSQMFEKRIDMRSFFVFLTLLVLLGCFSSLHAEKTVEEGFDLD